MSKQFDEIHSHFARNHIKLKRQWLDDLLKYLITYRNNADDLINLVFYQWLYTDLGQSTEAEAANATTANINNQQQIQTAHIFQIRSISDIGTPRYKQFKKMTDPGYDESTAELGINDFADGGNNFNPNKGAKCYCLQMADCRGEQFKAFEKKRVFQLSLATCPGSKILVFGGTKIVQDVFFLSPENCQFLGGAVEHLLRDQNILKQLSEQFGKTIPSAKQPAPTIAAVTVQEQQLQPKKPLLVLPVNLPASTDQMAAARLLRLVPSESALLVCDMQEKFRQHIQYFPQIVEVTRRMIEAAKLLDIKIIATEQNPKELGPTVPELELQKHGIPVFSKTKFSMVPDLQKELANGIKSVVVCGIEAHVCVFHTAIDFQEQGFQVHVIADGSSSRTMVDRIYAYKQLKKGGINLTTSECAILGLVGDSAHEKFKAVGKIINESAPDSGLLSRVG